MGAQFQMFKTLEKEIERLRSSEVPSHVFAILDFDNKVIRAIATTTVNNRTNSVNKLQTLTKEEFEKLIPMIENGEIPYHAIIDDMDCSGIEYTD